MADSIEKMKADIEMLRTRLEEVKRDRVARGLPADTPDDFLPVPLSGVLAERLTDTAAFIAKYAKLVLDGRQLLAVNVERLQEAKELADLLRRSKGRFLSIYGMAIHSAIVKIEKVSEAVANGQGFPESPKFVAERLYVYLNFGEGRKSNFYNDVYDQPEDKKQIYEECKRLEGDEAYLQAELDKYRKYYATIKHLY